MNAEYSDVENQLLVMNAQDGDISAMEKLVVHWQKRLWRHAYRMTNNIQAAWDVTQQSWIGIIKGLNRLEDPANFKAWAYRITTNKAADWCRKNEQIFYADNELLKNVECKEKKETSIEELLEKLDDKKKMVLILYYYEQLTVSEIGAVLNIPTGTVKSRLATARNELKKLLEKYE